MVQNRPRFLNLLTPNTDIFSRPAALLCPSRPCKSRKHTAVVNLYLPSEGIGRRERWGMLNLSVSAFDGNGQMDRRSVPEVPSRVSVFLVARER